MRTVRLVILAFVLGFLVTGLVAPQTHFLWVAIQHGGI